MVRKNEDKGVGIIGVGSYLPEKILTNKDLENMVDTSDEWIKTRTGIEERRILDDDKTTSYMAIKAAENAIKDSGIKKEQIDLIIVTTVTPDMAFPSTACLVQRSLGCMNAAAFDLEAACSGFLYGLSVAYGYIKSGLYKNILLISAEALSRIVDWTDRNTCVLFGDGAGAVILSEVPKDKGILSISLGADGTGADYLMQPAGGAKLPASEETIKNRLHYVKMDGNSVFKFAVKKMNEASNIAIERSGLQKEDIDYLIPHQANIRIIESARKRLKLPKDKVYINLDRLGNMSSASIPVALDQALKENKINNGDNVLFVGFGGGLTWGSCVIKWYR
ncbi:beta-ketoacyl-ACP synthase III [Caldisalinibacter kiritimatiensis]|uniref:Beta-ketoacyl-[acyl-carrier-protein] synthase III n=1 Tax=Caldisalinibacter kiritimatiensis TaxID=1304284 RepID=R1ATV5_9FIRM|nr:beta-ketoacyl-ACP synthase III [Caldisalinibacter kiritimatiensis]EOD00558.1 3-oxoacyl-[acyl-carrier-protein] synthase, KASIII [Caldisalinibacter kiritimatiensis]